MLNLDKIELINRSVHQFGIRSFADLGAVWQVDGGYTFRTLDTFDIQKACLVDTDITHKVETLAPRYPNLTVYPGEFGDPEIAQRIGKVDAVFLFDVLLHQVAPDWDQILDLYAPNTDIFIIYNQQWTGSSRTIRLLDLGEEEYYRNTPYTKGRGPFGDIFNKLDDFHPLRRRLWRDIHHIWQWGITDDDLIAKFQSIGFRPLFSANFGRFGELPNFENHGFIFAK